MSGSRLTRKVTVEGGKKISESSAPRKSVFDRLGPGTVEVLLTITYFKQVHILVTVTVTSRLAVVTCE